MNIGRLDIRYDPIWRLRFLWFGLHLEPGTRYYFSQRTFILIIDIGVLGIYWFRPYDLGNYLHSIVNEEPQL